MGDSKLIPKLVMTWLGARLSAGTMYNLNGLFNYLHVGWWLRAHNFHAGHFVDTRWQVFDWIAKEVGDQNVLYLEFGVHRGASMRHWSRLLQNPRSHLHGFDSFQGLPHDWSLEGHERGYFNQRGAIPDIDDPRVKFFPGWFDETLPNYEWPEHDRLVVMLDADLYSSTTTALRYTKHKLVPGSYLYFDQIHHRCDELRAFSELVDETSMKFRLACATREFTCTAFQRLADDESLPG